MKVYILIEDADERSDVIGVYSTEYHAFDRAELESGAKLEWKLQTPLRSMFETNITWASEFSEIWKTHHPGISHRYIGNHIFINYRIDVWEIQ